jgi:hypothetical protein
MVIIKIYLNTIRQASRVRSFEQPRLLPQSYDVWPQNTQAPAPQGSSIKVANDSHY